MIFLDVSYIY